MFIIPGLILQVVHFLVRVSARVWSLKWFITFILPFAVEGRLSEGILCVTAPAAQASPSVSGFFVCMKSIPSREKDILFFQKSSVRSLIAFLANGLHGSRFLL